MGNVIDGTSTALGSGFRLVSLVTSGNVTASRVTRDRSNWYSWDGDIAEILIYNTALSSNEERRVGSYLTTKYGLPAGYTYPPDLVNRAFVGNRCGNAGGYGGGGAINFAYDGGNGRREIRNSTFFANQTTWVAGSIRMRGGQLTIADSILWQSASDYSAQNEDETWVDSGNLTLSYCDIDTGQAAGAVFGPGLTNANPLFASATLPYDMHLKSTQGRWLNGGWVFDAVMSPCIDAGDPASDYALEPAGNGSRINLGRYGNTPEASRTKRILTGGEVLIVR